MADGLPDVSVEQLDHVIHALRVSGELARLTPQQPDEHRLRARGGRAPPPPGRRRGDVRRRPLDFLPHRGLHVGPAVRGGVPPREGDRLVAGARDPVAGLRAVLGGGARPPLGRRLRRVRRQPRRLLPPSRTTSRSTGTPIGPFTCSTRTAGYRNRTGVWPPNTTRPPTRTATTRCARPSGRSRTRGSSAGGFRTRSPRCPRSAWPTCPST